MDAFQRQFCAA